MAALDWRKSPDEFFSWTRDARIFAIAALRVKAALVDVLSESARKKADREARMKRG